MDKLQSLLKEIRACTLCAADMERKPNPIFQVSSTAPILVAGQAPGNLADVTGIPFNDPSGDRLRAWMGIDKDTFYNPEKLAIVPMGFCFPGYDKHGGDIPPMKRCAKTWHAELFSHLPSIKVRLLIGRYAHKWHLGPECPKSVTATVSQWTDFATRGIFVLPHPSWRNTAWLKKNPWFETDLLPVLQKQLQSVLG